MPDPQTPKAPRIRIVMTTSDFERDLPFYRDVLGLQQVEDYSTADTRAVVLDAGMATIELADEGHAAAVDALEVGRRVAGPIRVAFEVANTEGATAALVDAGANLIAEPVTTPWGSVNSRLSSPGGHQLTLFSER